MSPRLGPAFPRHRALATKAAGRRPTRSPEATRPGEGEARPTGGGVRLAALAGALLLLALLSGCEPEITPTPVVPKPTATRRALTPTAMPAAIALPSPSPSPPDAGLRRGGILRQVSTTGYPTLDPHLSSRQGLDGYGLLYNHLLSYVLVDEKAGRFEVRPELAASFERVEPATYLFRLRKGVKFHDGSELDAETVRWNLDRILTHPRSSSRAVLEMVRDVEVVDGATVRIRTSRPSAALPVLLTRGGGGMAAMISRTALEKLGEDAFAAHGVGTGPMEYIQWQHGGQLALKRWDKYWERGADGQLLPYLAGYIEQVVPDPAAGLQELKEGRAALMAGIEAGQVPAVKADDRLGYWELPWAGPAYLFTGFNTESGPFRSQQLRQAALYSMDREKLAASLAPGLGRAHYYPFWQPATLGYDETLPRYSFDLERARRLVKEAGQGEEPEVAISTVAGQPEERITELVKGMWAEAGMKVRLEATEALAFHSKLAVGAYQAGFWRDLTPMVDPELVSARVAKGDLNNIYSYNNASLDACLLGAAGDSVPAQRAEAYRRCQRILYEDAGLGSGYRLPENRAFSRSLQGLTVQFVYDDLRAVWLKE